MIQLVYESILKYENQMGSEERELSGGLRKAYARLEKVHAASDWAAVPLPALGEFRAKLKEYSSHTFFLLNAEQLEAAFTISVRPVY